MVGPLRAPYLSTTTKRLTSKRLGARARGSSADPRGAADWSGLDPQQVKPGAPTAKYQSMFDLYLVPKGSAVPQVSTPAAALNPWRLGKG